MNGKQANEVSTGMILTIMFGTAKCPVCGNGFTAKELNEARVGDEPRHRKPVHDACFAMPVDSWRIHRSGVERVLYRHSRSSGTCPARN